MVRLSHLIVVLSITCIVLITLYQLFYYSLSPVQYYNALFASNNTSQTNDNSIETTFSVLDYIQYIPPPVTTHAQLYQTRYQQPVILTQHYNIQTETLSVITHCHNCTDYITFDQCSVGATLLSEDRLFMDAIYRTDTVTQCKMTSDIVQILSNQHLTPGLHNTQYNIYSNTTLFITVLGNTQPIYKYCIVTQIRNQAKFLAEWIHYHKWFGIQHFIIYDNNSNDALYYTLSEYDFNGIVTVIQWPWRKTQYHIYLYSRIVLEHICDRVAYTDIDEFLFYRNCNKTTESCLQQLIAQYDQSQLVLYSEDYASSGLLESPTEAVTSIYTQRFDDKHNYRLFKSIVILRDTTYYTYIHKWLMQPNTTVYNISYTDAVVIHYKFKAWPDYVTKYESRSGTVSDWTVPLNLSQPDRTWWNHRYGVKDTRFRDYIADNNIFL